jgi:putative ABC transport system ATP-binding protein
VRDLASGGEELVHLSQPGGYFGELAPMFGLRRSATARARGPAVVTGYSLRDFRQRQTS